MKISVKTEIEIKEEDAKYLVEEFKHTDYYGDSTVDIKTKIAYYILCNGIKDMNNLIYDLKYLEQCRTAKGALIL